MGGETKDNTQVRSFLSLSHSSISSGSLRTPAAVEREGDLGSSRFSARLRSLRNLRSKAEGKRRGRADREQVKGTVHKYSRLFA